MNEKCEDKRRCGGREGRAVRWETFKTTEVLALTSSIAGTRRAGVIYPQRIMFGQQWKSVGSGSNIEQWLLTVCRSVDNLKSGRSTEKQSMFLRRPCTLNFACLLDAIFSCKKKQQQKNNASCCRQYRKYCHNNLDIFKVVRETVHIFWAFYLPCAMTHCNIYADVCYTDIRLFVHWICVYWAMFYSAVCCQVSIGKQNQKCLAAAPQPQTLSF